jgi:hypothetical protein
MLILTMTDPEETNTMIDTEIQRDTMMREGIY